MGLETLGRSGTGWRTLGKVWDGSGDLHGGPKQVGGPSGRFGTGRGPTGRSGMFRWTIGEVRDGSGDPWGGLGWVGVSRGGSRRVVTPSG